MRPIFGNPNAVAREIQGQFRQGTDKVVSVPLFCLFAKARWPKKTAENLAAYATERGRPCTDRTAARWLSGEHDPDVLVAFAFAMDMFKRDRG